MAVSPQTVSYELTDYSSVLRRRWWIVLVATCLGVAAAGGYASVAHKSYTSTVLVQVNALPTNSTSATGANATGARTTGVVNMDNEAQIVQSVTVAALANKQLHSPKSLQDLVKQIFVAVPPNTTFLQISCHESSADLAASCANDFANAYLATSLAKAVTATSHTAATLSAGVARLTTAIRRLRLQVSYLKPKAPRRIADRVSLNVDNISLSGLENQLNQTSAELASLGAGSAGSIASPAIPPSTPSSPRLLLLLPSGLLAGLVIGLILAFVVDRRDKRVHASRELERFFGVPVLLNTVPRKAGLQRAIVSPTSPSGEGFAQLAQSVVSSFGHGDHVLLVAGTSSGISSSVVAANLAATLARSRADVVLVCAGRDEAMVGRLFGTGEGAGLNDLLAGRATLGEAARQAAGITRLRVIGQGRGSVQALDDPHDAVGRLLSALSDLAHYVIVDVPSVREDATTYTMAEFADGAVIAVEIDRTTRDEVQDCIVGLHRVHVPVIGAAVLPRLPHGPARGRQSALDAGPHASGASLDETARHATRPPISASAHGSNGDSPGDGNGAAPGELDDRSTRPPAVTRGSQQP